VIFDDAGPEGVFSPFFIGHHRSSVFERTIRKDAERRLD
jgi:hypothetical protein